MKRWGIVAAVLLIAVGGFWFFTSWEEEAAGTGMNIPEPDEEVLKEFEVELANASNRFGLQLLGELVDEGENVLISPTSIYTDWL